MAPRRALPTDARATARRPDIFETDPRSRLSRGVTSERDEREATGTHAPMAEGPLAWLHPFDSGLHSFPSLDAGTDLLGLPPSNCGVAAKMAFSELAAMDLLRTPSGFDTRAADAQPPETSRRVTGADATSAGEKPFAFDAQRAHAGAPSTSYVPSEVRLPLIDDPCASDLPPFGSYRRSPRPTRAYAGGTLENQSTDVFSFPSNAPRFSPPSTSATSTSQTRSSPRCVSSPTQLSSSWFDSRESPSIRALAVARTARHSENTSLRFFRGCPDNVADLVPSDPPRAGTAPHALRAHLRRTPERYEPERERGTCARSLDRPESPACPAPACPGATLAPPASAKGHPVSFQVRHAPASTRKRRSANVPRYFEFYGYGR